MWYEDKIMRTLRCRTVQKPGALGRLLTAVLGLGDIGPLAAMPVMEGKASLMETLCGLSGGPILLDTKDVKCIIDTVVAIAPTFSAIQLEDISAPRCFEIEAKIQERVRIPVMPDDQHGTAVVRVALEQGLNRDDVTGYFD